MKLQIRTTNESGKLLRVKEFDTTDMYLDFVNNFLSVEKFAEHYGISEDTAGTILKSERELNNLLEKGKEL